MATLQHTTFQAFIKRHPVLIYFALTFAISWGALLIVVGPAGITAENTSTPFRGYVQSGPRPFHKGIKRK